MIVHHLGSVAKQKLLDICYQFLNTGTFPVSWKEAIIIPIPKKGKDGHSKTSYRPISLLSCLGKTMERMVNRRLQHHLEKNCLLPPPPPPPHRLASGRTETKWHRLPRISRNLPVEDEDSGCLCRPHQGFRQNMDGGSSLQVCMCDFQIVSS